MKLKFDGSVDASPGRFSELDARERLYRLFQKLDEPLQSYYPGVGAEKLRDTEILICHHKELQELSDGASTYNYDESPALYLMVFSLRSPVGLEQLFIHECCYVFQFLTGRLVKLGAGNLQWDGEQYDTSSLRQWLRPWEHDAELKTMNIMPALGMNKGSDRFLLP